MKSKYSEDPQTAEMIDIVMAGRTFDIGFTYGVSIFEMFPFCLRDMVLNGKTDIMSHYASIKKAVDKGLESLNDLYRD